MMTFSHRLFSILSVSNKRPPSVDPENLPSAPKVESKTSRDKLAQGEAEGAPPSLLLAIEQLSAYIWPADKPRHRVRVALAMVCLMAAKVMNVWVPLLFKQAVDELGRVQARVKATASLKSALQEQATEAAAKLELAQQQLASARLEAREAHQRVVELATKHNVAVPSLDASALAQHVPTATDAAAAKQAACAVADQCATAVGACPETTAAVADSVASTVESVASTVEAAMSAVNAAGQPSLMVAVPVSVLLGYGIARALASFTNELRSALFAKVTQDGIQSIAVDLFRHLLTMDAKFHLERNTGALTRAIDRGQRSIGFVLNSLAFNIVPTALEISLVLGILTANCGVAYAAIAAATLTAYIGFTVGITKWRGKFRREMNKADNEASARAFDALINSSTVQAFSNIEYETKRYNDIISVQNRASVATNESLALLNWGQNVIFSAGMTAVMLLAAHGVAAGTMVRLITLLKRNFRIDVRCWCVSVVVSLFFLFDLLYSLELIVVSSC